VAHLLVIGGASSDILHFAGPGGVQVSLLGPRPDPIPEMLRPIAARLAAWLGPASPPGALPHFEIAYQDGEAVYLQFCAAAESDLTPDLLSPDLSTYDCVHVTPLGDARQQLAFLQACRQRGAQRISVGTCVDLVSAAPDAVRSSVAQADLFFMNEKEATALFGSVEGAKVRAGQVLFVTLGAGGAVVIQGDHPTRVPAVPCDALDPTGTGDTFCGATLAGLLLGAHPVMAAHAATSLAAQMTEHVGPEALLWPESPPGVRADARVVVDGARVQRVSELIAKLPEVVAFDFTGPDCPPAGHPAALDFFFAATLQQFGFWTHRGGRYHLPLIAPINGALRKGSSYLWLAYMRPLTDPGFYTPPRQAALTLPEMLALLRADDGADPMPAVELHLAQAQAYGRDMLALGLTPRDVVEAARSTATPLQTFLELLDHVGGYKEDPLRKKSGLLALILNQRPEAFLPLGPGEEIPPIIDYHVMRFCLRVGLVDVVDETLRQKLAGRQLLQPADEWSVRYAAYRAVQGLVAAARRSTGAVDYFMFNSRKRCPEMTEPVCGLCAVDPVCAHRKELFQPVLRTTFY
jgi:hypothetical protein